ncbi:MAG: hemerythrin domain-containing protein [Actinomycetales bacterium]|nr:hemerythrin domain-containing protein [Actinomycetales bacterium]
MTDRPSMSMNQIIHSAVRRDFARLEDALGRADATAPDRAEAVAHAYDHLASQLHHHHVTEEKHVLPALTALGVPAEVTGHVASEHADMVRALAAADSAMADYRRAPDEGTLDAARRAVAMAAKVTVRHLDHEEQEVEPLLTELHDTPEWQAAEKQIRKEQPLRVTGAFLAWLNDGLAPEARAALDQQIPRAVQSVLMTIFGRRYRKDIAPVLR